MIDPKGTNRARDAIAVSDGACNPTAIVNAMARAIEEIKASPNYAGTRSITDDPALALMAHQLAFLCCKSEPMSWDYGAARIACGVAS